MKVVYFGTKEPYKALAEFVLERIEALTIALGGKPASAAGPVPRDDDWDDFDDPTV